MEAETTSALFEAMIADPSARARFAEDRELDFSFVAAEAARCRVNASFQQGTVKLSLRLLPPRVPSLSELDLPAVCEKLASEPKGLVLVCGPSGSGKSTTLAAMVDYINRRFHKVVVTVEDPIEYIHHYEKSIVCQREVGTDTRDFAAALRHVLRQDPDVILIGEMRDLETMAMALTAAETGHLVLSTLHTNSASEAADRIIDVFPPAQQGQIRVQLAMTLAGVLYQVLLPRQDNKGRIACCEVLVGTPAIRNLIRGGKTHEIPSYLTMGREREMRTLEQALQDLKARGLVRDSEVVSYTKSPQETPARPRR